MGANYTSANYRGANYTGANYTSSNYASAIHETYHIDHMGPFPEYLKKFCCLISSILETDILFTNFYTRVFIGKKLDINIMHADTV